MVGFDPIELRSRREALGLSQVDLARLLGIKQNTVSQWEAGMRSPRDPVSILMALSGLEDEFDDLVDRIAELGEHASAVRDSSSVELRTYASDAVYWVAEAAAARKGIPAAMHRAATAYAARALENEQAITARIISRRHNQESDAVMDTIIESTTGPLFEAVYAATVEACPPQAADDGWPVASDTALDTVLAGPDGARLTVTAHLDDACGLTGASWAGQLPDGTLLQGDGGTDDAVEAARQWAAGLE